MSYKLFVFIGLRPCYLVKRARHEKNEKCIAGYQLRSAIAVNCLFLIVEELVRRYTYTNCLPCIHSRPGRLVHCQVCTKVDDLEIDFGALESKGPETGSGAQIHNTHNP